MDRAQALISAFSGSNWRGRRRSEQVVHDARRPAVQAQLAVHEAPRPVLEAVGHAAATHRGDDPGGEPVDFRHPHFWAPFIHLGIP